MLTNHWDIEDLVTTAKSAADAAVMDEYGTLGKHTVHAKYLWLKVFDKTYHRLVFGHRRGEWHSDANAVKSIVTAQN